MKDKSIIRLCKALAEKACTNFSNHYYLSENRACHLISTRYPCIHDGATDCDYFITAVLPSDKELHRLVLSRLFDSDEHTPLHTRLLRSLRSTLRARFSTAEVLRFLRHCDAAAPQSRKAAPSPRTKAEGRHFFYPRLDDYRKDETRR